MKTLHLIGIFLNISILLFSKGNGLLTNVNNYQSDSLILTKSDALKFTETPFKKLKYLKTQQLIAGITEEKQLCFFNQDYAYTHVSFNSVAEIIEYQGNLYLFQEVVELKCDTIQVYYLDDTEPDTSETIVKYYNELTAYKLIKYNPNTKTTSYLAGQSGLNFK